MIKIIKYVIADLLRNRTIMVYTLVLLALSISVFSMEDNAEKGVASLLNIILFVVPLVSIVFSTVYLYNSAEFIELLVSQPLKRQTIWMSIFVGLAGAVAFAFLIGVGIPVILYAFMPSGIVLVLCGIILSLVLWLYFALLFDAIVLFIVFQFSEYPIENGMVALSMFNPVDISRILILLQIDVSAMMGYTGAIFRNFFGTAGGMSITIGVLLLWIALPLCLSVRHFKGKDL
jgi:Cu-processing system permease protein